MLINQFYDTGLAHASYAVLRNGKMIIIDPGRDPKPYYDFAALHQADIVGVIETHPHADFVSSHLEIHGQTGATIYVSKLVGATYPHQTFDDGDEIALTDIKLKAINTPGHSPDSICIVVEDETGRQTAVFTGDTLFVGDVGRPDLRENAGNITAQKEELARQLYHSTRQKLMRLPRETTVYPAHGPGSLCGKNMSPDLQSTIGRELRENYALQLMDELQFVQMLTEHQPFVPRYFGYNVEMNRQGAANMETTIAAVPRIAPKKLKAGATIIDTRQATAFKAGHLPGAINLQNNGKFETWLGSVINNDEPFYLIAADDATLESMIRKTAKIGYEQNILAAILPPNSMSAITPSLDLNDFNRHPSHYTIIDVRNHTEVEEGRMFKHALSIPLPELRERLDEIPLDKPIVVHCAGGYRSAAAASIVAGKITQVPVYDLGEEIANYPILR
ncbi:glyoxylase-like metal-dependent hydrolase (beta-lactamase superfamily II) [Mucilaginibacter yixingensis]|uniref:Glyoxylase-like metal-dependent hydrolase (Beta-lactamase superfamily II) n=1 Tax=Mucilaginibacter yixingensis TaxID=1295612 RepID=A0A2T5J7C8_9SPHI|nr:MBL fold metallo-hydrolase [Mucilaginibacter yixingensis]PTQ95054.1 glyoxylase-like metal-dependent hydrolase (beta-lactamase superfamily II) [Mucilaginibacter yixingensis]